MRYLPRLLIIFNLICVATFAYFFLSGGSFSKIKYEDRRIFGVSYANFSKEYYRELNDSIYSSISEKNDILLYKDAKASQSLQNEQVKELIEQGCEIIVISPVDEAVKEAIDYCKAEGVPVILLDKKKYEDEGVDLSVVIDSYALAQDLAKYLIASKNSAKVLIIHDELSGSREALRGFSDTIDTNQSGDFEIVASVLCESKEELSYEKIKEYEDMGYDTIFTSSDELAIYAHRYNDKAGILSIDASPMAKRMVWERKMLATAATFPALVGENCVDMIYKIAEGEEFKSRVIMPSKLITVDTISSYELEKWE